MNSSPPRPIENIFGLLIHGYSITINSEQLKEARSRIENDFRAFRAPPPETPQLTIVARPLSAAPARRGLPLWQTRMCQVRQVSFKERLCLYTLPGSQKIDALLRHRDCKTHKEVELFCDNEVLFCEIVYMLILSSCGEAWDQKGLMRMHAAVVSLKNKPFVFWGPRGAGKSTLTAHLLANPEIQFFSDEHGLLNIETEMLIPFPLRMALDPNHIPTQSTEKTFDLKRQMAQATQRFFLDHKAMTEISLERHAKTLPFQNFIVLGVRKKNNVNHLTPLSPWVNLALFFNILLGIGLIQMSEFLLRPTSIPMIVRISINRLRLLRLIVKAKPLLWHRSQSLRDNLAFCDQMLKKFSSDEWTQAIE
jgi:hypothetical protein